MRRRSAVHRAGASPNSTYRPAILKLKVTPPFDAVAGGRRSACTCGNNRIDATNSRMKLVRCAVVAQAAVRDRRKTGRDRNFDGACAEILKEPSPSIGFTQ